MSTESEPGEAATAPPPEDPGATEPDTDTDTDTGQEVKVVRVVRGSEYRAIAKWERNGWELVTQEGGRLRSELTFRRPRRTFSWAVAAASAGAILMVVAIVVLAVLAFRINTDDASKAPTAVGSDGEAGVDEPAAPDDSDELDALLAEAEPDPAAVQDLADTYQGRTIELDGHVESITEHADYTTRFDIVVRAGEPDEATGPDLALDNVAIMDLGFDAADEPRVVEQGDRWRLTATVESYDDDTGALVVVPVSTATR